MALLFAPLGHKISSWQLVHPVEIDFYMNVFVAVTMISATWIMLKFIDSRPLVTIGLSTRYLLRYLSAGLAVGIAWLLLSVGFAWLLGFVVPVAPVGFSWYVLIVSSVSMLINVFVQELLLCGFILQTILKYSNTIIAVLLSSLLFSGYHAGAFKGEMLPVLNVFAAGIVFCLAYVITNNLWFPIFIHFAWDVLLGPVLGLVESGKNLGGGWKMLQLKGPSIFTGGQFGLEGGLIVTFTAAFIIFLLYYFQYQKSKV